MIPFRSVFWRIQNPFLGPPTTRPDQREAQVSATQPIQPELATPIQTTGLVYRVWPWVLNYLSPSETARVSLMNKDWYRLVVGQPFIPLKGEKDRYALLRVLTREHASQILNQTGRRIRWPDGQPHLKVVTSRTEDTTSKLCFGRGNFGVFCIGYALSQKKYVGLKIIEGGYGVEAELAIQRALHDVPHIMQSLDCCKVVNSTGEALLYQVMDLAGLGNVSQLRSTIQGLTDESFKGQLQFYIAKGFFLGLSHMHGLHYVHLDVKLANLVVDHTGEVFLIDFGCSKQTGEGKVSGLHTQADYNYYSPERWLATYSIGDLCNGAKIDAWAAGLALLELFLPGEVPIKRIDIEQLLENPPPKGLSHRQVLAQYYDDKLATTAELRSPNPDSPWAVIKKLLIFDPEARLSVAEALQQPWFVYSMQTAIERREATLSRLRELVQSQPLKQGICFEKGAYIRGARAGIAHAMEQKSLRTGLFSPQEVPLPHFTNYVSRVELERCLKQRLLSDASFTVCQGMPGIGKTQLVTYLLHDLTVESYFGLKLWFREPDQAAQIELQYLTLARELGLVDKETSFEEAFPRVLQYLRSYREKTQKSWLMVFDNASDPEVLRPYLPEGGHILVTTRSKEWEGAIAIEKLTPAEGMLLVQRLLQQENPDAENLCNYFAYIPLGLVQACAYIRNHGLTISAFLDRLSSSSSAFERNETLYGKELPYSLVALYRFTLKELEGTLAIEFLNFFAYLSSDAIPMALAENIGPPEELEPLFRYGLIQDQANNSFTIHRLLQGFVRLSHPCPASFIERALWALCGTSTLTPADHTARKINWQLIPHGRALFAHFDALSLPYRDLEDALSEALTRIGHALRDLGDAKSARGYYERALAIDEKTYGPDHPKMAVCLSNLGVALLKRGDARGAKSYLERALAIDEKTYGPDHPKMAVCLSNLGNALQDLGDAKSARGYYERALAIDEKTHGLDHPKVAVRLNNLGNALLDLGNARIAKSYLERALAIYEKTYDANHPEIAQSLSSLGTVLCSLGDARSGKSYLERALAIDEKVYGSDHPDVARRLNSLGNVLCDLGDPKSARGYYERALAIDEKTYGFNHPMVADSLNNLGCALLDLKNVQEARGYLKRALALYEQTYDFYHPKVATCLGNLGCALKDLKDAEGSKRCLERALAIDEKIYGSHHPKVAVCLNNLGVALQDFGDVRGAKDYFKRAYSIAMNHRWMGLNHPRARTIKENLSSLSHIREITNSGYAPPVGGICTIS